MDPERERPPSLLERLLPISPSPNVVNAVEEWEENVRCELLDQTYHEDNLHIDAIADHLSSASASSNQPQGNANGLASLPQSARRGGSARGSARGTSRGGGVGGNRNSSDPGGGGPGVSLEESVTPTGRDSLPQQQEGVEHDPGVDLGGDSSHLFRLLESLREDEGFEEKGEGDDPNPDPNPNTHLIVDVQINDDEATRGGNHGDGNNSFNERYGYVYRRGFQYLYARV